MLAPYQFGVIPELRQPLRGSAGKVAGTVFTGKLLLRMSSMGRLTMRSLPRGAQLANLAAPTFPWYTPELVVIAMCCVPRLARTRLRGDNDHQAGQ